MTDKGVTLVICLLCVSTAWAQPTDTEPNSDCFHGWTGPNSGGSCSFNKEGLCDWRNVDDNNIDWDLEGDTQVGFEPGWWESESDMGRLRSPAMCEEVGDQVCLKFKYQITGKGGTRLNVEVCGQQSPCKTLFQDEDTGDWIVKSIQFVTPGLFEIFLKAEIFDTKFYSESSIYIDYVRYNKSSCDLPIVVTSPTTDSSSTVADSSVSDDSKEEKEEAGQRKESKKEENDDDEEGEAEGLPTTTTIIVAVSVIMVIVLVVAVVVAVVLVRRHHGSSPRKLTGGTTTTSVTTATSAQPSGARYEPRKESIVMVSNELYNCVGQITAPFRVDDAPTTSSPRQQERPSTTTTTPTTTTMTSPGKRPQTDDVSHACSTSPNRPVASPPPRGSTHSDNTVELQTILSSISPPPPKTQQPSTDKDGESEEEQLYENSEEKGLYENADAAGQDKGTYENMSTGNATKPASALENGADDTYERMMLESSEYSHLANRGQRADCRRTNYDHIE